MFCEFTRSHISSKPHGNVISTHTIHNILGSLELERLSQKMIARLYTTPEYCNYVTRNTIRESSEFKDQSEHMESM